jgi:Domain of unknown function (DUF4440)
MTTGIEATLLDLENRQWEANRNADGNFYRGYLTDDALVVSRFGVLDREQILQQFLRDHRARAGQRRLASRLPPADTTVARRLLRLASCRATAVARRAGRRRPRRFSLSPRSPRRSSLSGSAGRISMRTESRPRTPRG